MKGICSFDCCLGAEWRICKPLKLGLPFLRPFNYPLLHPHLWHPRITEGWRKYTTQHHHTAALFSFGDFLIGLPPDLPAYTGRRMQGERRERIVDYEK